MGYEGQRGEKSLTYGRGIPCTASGAIVVNGSLAILCFVCIAWFLAHLWRNSAACAATVALIQPVRWSFARWTGDSEAKCFVIAVELK
jgi:hypothetical protein